MPWKSANPDKKFEPIDKEHNYVHESYRYI